MSEVVLITREELKAIPYGDALKQKFEELGVGDLWKPGTKKDAMITKALEKLALLKSLTNTGLSKEEAEIEVEKKELKKKETEQIIEDNKIFEEQKSKEEEIKAVEKKALTKEEIEANILNINRNLANNVKSQREPLLKKKRALQELLSKVEKDEEKVVGKGDE